VRQDKPNGAEGFKGEIKKTLGPRIQLKDAKQRVMWSKGNTIAATKSVSSELAVICVSSHQAAAECSNATKRLRFCLDEAGGRKAVSAGFASLELIPAICNDTEALIYFSINARRWNDFFSALDNS